MRGKNDLRRFIFFSLVVSMLWFQTACDKHQATVASPASAKGAAVHSMEIRRHSKADKLANELAQIADHSNIALQSQIKFTQGEPFISKLQLDSPMVIETYLDEIDMPSLLLEDFVRTATCVPYKSLKPLHLLPLGAVKITSPQKVSLNFFSGVEDRFSVGDNWFQYSNGPSEQIIQLVDHSAPVGVSESVFLKNFHLDGGLCPSSFQRYCLNDKTVDGRAIKINVEISNHQIKRRSLPYIEQAYFD
ncbi:MAG: hypothetical protein HYX67_06965 [Candidatus Melainabacteria bacterium]|nr:hypothetical protein [Candidatus Melainabacteria bacterium]